MFAYVIDDKFPVTKNHKLIIPKRHINSFFDMGDAEYKGVMNLLKRVREELMEKDKSITAFNVGVNDG